MEKTKIFKQGWFLLLAAIVVFLLNQLPFITDVRPVMYDEAWYGNTAYNCAQGLGFLNTAVGSRGNANFLLPLMTAGFMHIFGYNLLAIRLTAVFCGLLTLMFMGLAFRQIHIGYMTKICVYAFFVSIALYNTIFRFGRPECAGVMCLMGGLWMYLRYRENPTWVNILGMSVFVYLAAIGHPFTLLFFAILGSAMLIQVVRNKNWMGSLQLALLLIAAIGAIISVSWASNTYNIPGEDYVQTRFSIRGIMTSIPVYFKHTFLSKHTLYILPLLCMVTWLAIKNLEYRELAVSSIIFFFIFPVLFSPDLSMVGLGADYFVCATTLLLAPFIETVKEKKRFALIFIAYCIFNFGLSYYYNYAVKYEKSNTVLTKELQEIIPQDAKVYGALRQWPFLMRTAYQSDHTCFPVHPQEEYDYIVLNSQDMDRSATSYILPIDSTKMNLVYSRATRQYGEVMVYKRIELK